MKLGIMYGYSGAKIDLSIAYVKKAESMGFDSIWTAEAWGSDAVAPAAWMLAQTDKIKVGTAIMQMPARSPAMAAMTAMTLAELSGGRFICGLGASGPQVVEGWHGVPYGMPVTRLKEYISIMKQIFRREAPTVFDGKMYQLPYKGPGATGLGKPLKSILHSAEHIPIMAATLTPKGVAAAAEVADGFFPVWMNPERFDVFEEPIKKGFAAAGDKSMTHFDIAPFVTCSMGDDIEECMIPIRHSMALYIGGMGARDKNFYTDYAKRLGYEEAALKIQDLFLAGRKDEAAAAVPAELIDACHLIGPKARIQDRLQRWKEADKRGHVTNMLISTRHPDALEVIAEAML